ncbi:hypothetical protein [Bacillus salipaludis]|uniref:STAS domain-containing protein n=1 Tax=Bacillus salipaludis TaxID=2547811 RepID=A0ABW8REL9_9BACI
MSVSGFFSVAFINFSGLQLLTDLLKEAEKKGIEGRLSLLPINFTVAKALEKSESLTTLS